MSTDYIYHNLVAKLYYQAVDKCAEDGVNTAWLFETYFAEAIAEHCAMIAQDCIDLGIPLSKVPDKIRKFKRPLTPL
jgi:acyl-CoA synthetase (NDP forming)